MMLVLNDMSEYLEYDAEKTNEFIEELFHVLKSYNSKAELLYSIYNRYCYNDTFVGEMADKTKLYISAHQKFLSDKYELQTDIYKKYCSIDDNFKEIVDASPKARIKMPILKKVKSDYQELSEYMGYHGKKIMHLAQEIDNEFGEYADFETPDFQSAICAFEEFCGSSGFLDKCINKFIEFDRWSADTVDKTGFYDEEKNMQKKLRATADSLDSMTVYQPNIEKKSIDLITFGTRTGAFLGVMGVQEAINSRKALDAKVDKWLSPDYKLSPEEVKEAQQLAKIKLSSLKFDPILGCPILRTKEEKELYKRYSALANKVSKLGCFMMGVRKPIYNLLDFTLDCSDFIMSHTTGLIIEKGSDLIDHCFGTDTNKYIHLFVNSYKDFRGDVDKEIETAIDNSKLQNSKEFGYGEAAGVLLLYYITSEISATLEMGKEVGFSAKQAKENIQDLVLDTRELYQELSRDGELSKSDWVLLGENVAGNFSMNLFFGGFSEVTDIFKPSKDLHLKRVEKVAEEAENVRKVEKAVDGASDVTKVTQSTSEDIWKGTKKVENISDAKGLIGHDFEDYLTKEIGGDGSFSVGGRDFDGGVGNHWWEAKSGQYWDMLENNPSKKVKFKSDMGDRLRIAEENGATYELYSNTPIPDDIKKWLTKKGIVFTEILE